MILGTNRNLKHIVIWYKTNWCPNTEKAGLVDIQWQGMVAAAWSHRQPVSQSSVWKDALSILY